MAALREMIGRKQTGGEPSRFVRRWRQYSSGRTAGLVIAALVVTAPGARAQSTEWTWPQIAFFGDWYDADNWTAGVPDSETDAILNNGGAADMSGGSAQAKDLHAGNVALAIRNGASFTTQRGVVNGYVQVGGAVWTSDEIIVGTGGPGFPSSPTILLVYSGGVITSQRTTVGLTVGIDGNLQVGLDGTPLGGTFNAGELYVGAGGNGYVDVLHDSTLTSLGSILGLEAAGYGRVLISGENALWNSQGLVVGQSGGGSMEIRLGRVVTSGDSDIGLNVGSDGSVIVDGAGSSWDTTNFVSVGVDGEGNLTASNGASVTATALRLGLFASGTGTLNIGTGGLAGVLNAGAVSGGAGTAIVNFNHSDDFISATAFLGSLAFNKLGAGTLTLTEANDYAGGTTISGGTLQLGNGGTSGSIAGNIVNNAVLAFNRSDDFTFGGQISGSGALNKLGTGTLILTGYSGDFTGATTISGGVFAMNGVIGGTVDVLSGSTLGGIGTVGTTTAASGANIAPGLTPGAIGTLTVSGDISFAGSSSYAVDITPALQSDVIDVDGTAAIDGGTVNVVKAAGVYVPGNRWTIIDAAGGVSGVFDGFTQNSPAMNLPFATLALAYDPTHVYLDVTRNAVRFCGLALTSNQCVTGNGAESTGAGNPVYNAIAALPDAASVPGALEALSGEVHASVISNLLDDSRFVRAAASERVRAAFEGVAAASLPVSSYGPDGLELAPATMNEGLAVWGRGFGSWGERDSNGNAAGLDHSIGGFLVGADTLVSDSWRLGVIAGYSRTSFDIDERSSSGSSDNYHLGVYGGRQWGALGLRTGAAYSWHSIRTDRQVVFPSFAENLSVNYDAGTAQVFGELGYRIDTAPASFEPFANVSYIHVSREGFAETGGAAALTSPGATTDVTFTTFGLRASTDLTVAGRTLTARGMLGWRHAFGEVTPNTIFAFAGGDTFAIAGTPIARDAVALEAGVDVDLTPSATLGIAYSGQIASSAREHGFKATVNARF